MPTISLTQHFIQTGLVCPADKAAITYYCSKVGGFAVNVARGRPHRGLYRLQHKVNGKSTWEKLGSTDSMTLEQARAKAIQFKELKAQRPKVETLPTDKPKEVPTLNAFFKLHYLPYVKPRKRSWKRDDEMFRLRISPVFGGMLLTEIQRQAVQSFHANLNDSGLAPATADHHLKLLRFMLNLAVEWELIPKNPIAGIRLFNADNKVENLLSENELGRLVHVLETDRNRTICHVALFLLSTGARLSEALQAKWEHVDLERRTWRIPATNAKSKRVRVVPLNDSAMVVLRRLRTRDTNVHVFINPQTGKPYTTMMKVWARLRRLAELPHLRIHDLRHCFASLLVGSGRSLYETQTILGHSDPKVTMRYAHLGRKTLLDAANSASLLASMSQTPPGLPQATVGSV